MSLNSAGSIPALTLNGDMPWLEKIEMAKGSEKQIEPMKKKEQGDVTKM
jgi:hypothetical protein